MIVGKSIEEYLKEKGILINAKLKEYLGDEKSPQYLKRILGRTLYKYDEEVIDKAILGPIWHLLEIGGKRLRPILTLAVMDSLGVDSSNYLEFAVVPEIVHNATIIHDDIEDDSDIRRGRETLHAKYGIDVALNLGDFMFFFPMSAMLDSEKINNDKKIMLQRMYSRHMLRLGVGQGVDIAWHNQFVDISKRTEDNYLQLAFDKTGALTSMAAEIGAIVANAEDDIVELFGRFGASLGVAFQIKDDILNIIDSGVSENKGVIGEDITEGKVTLLVIHTINSADEKDKRRIIELLKMHTKDRGLINEAIEIIKKYNSIEYAENIALNTINESWKNLSSRLNDSPAKERLKQISDFVVNRKI
jgi:geranylgeranyl pyrophosphate synthase